MDFRPFRSHKSCPQTTNELQQHENELECHSPKRYHCIRNEYGILGEICHETSWIQKGYCPEYNTVSKRVDSAKCDGNIGVCPLVTYFSNEAVSYSSCVREGNIRSKTWTSRRPRESTTIDSSNAPKETKTVTIVTSSVVTILVLLALIALAVLLYKKIYLRRRNKENKADKDEIQAPDDKGKETPVAENVQHADEDELQTLLPDMVNPDTEKVLVAHAARLISSAPRTMGTFCTTRARNEIEQLMLEHKAVFVSGLPGSGKTSTCLDILRTYGNISEGTIYETAVYNDVQDVDAEKINDHTVMLFDDCLEKWFYIQTKMEKDEDNMRKIFQRNNKLKCVYALFTMRRCTQKAFTDQLGAWTKCIGLTFIEMESDDARLTRVECKEILKAKRSLYKQDEERLQAKTRSEDIEELVSQTLKWQSTVGQTEALEILYMTSMSAIDLENFFPNPDELLKKDFESFSESFVRHYRWQYCTMVYLLMKGGTVAVKPIDSSLMNKIVKLLQFKGLKGICLSVSCPWTTEVEKDRLTFQHEYILTRFLFHMCVESSGSIKWDEIDFIIENCNIAILIKYFRIKETTKKVEKDIFFFKFGMIFKDFRPKLAKRFAQTYHVSNSEDIKNHVNLNDSVFKSKFEKELNRLRSTMPQTEEM